MTAKVIELSAREARLKRMIRGHLRGLGFTRAPDGTLCAPSLDKDTYRAFHAAQREEKLDRNRAWLDRSSERLLRWFADGSDVVPRGIRPQLELVYQGTWQSDLFRMAAMYWQIPVSDGYGRRMRFLVWDRSNEKLIGIIALGDAVFNQAARDAFVGWDHHRRKDALVNLMDAYVLGAVPPYSQILGGKLVASLISTREVAAAFKSKYASSVGLISGKSKRAKLVAVTTTSALGRSSIYNRLRLEGRLILEPIGFTSGWGHFHFSGKIFDELRSYLEDIGDGYADGFDFGSGPNWRIRVIRKALDRLGMDSSLAKHGFKREVYFSRLATNAEAYLRGDEKRACFDQLQSIDDRGEMALGRWVIPRADRDASFLEWRKERIISSIYASGQKTFEDEALGMGA